MSSKQGYDLGVKRKPIQQMFPFADIVTSPARLCAVAVPHTLMERALWPSNLMETSVYTTAVLRCGNSKVFGHFHHKETITKPLPLRQGESSVYLTMRWLRINICSGPSKHSGVVYSLYTRCHQRQTRLIQKRHPGEAPPRHKASSSPRCFHTPSLTQGRGNTSLAATLH